MQLENKLINKTYDKYEISDFDILSGDLNPAREIQFDKTEVIIKKLQLATNNIIRKRIMAPEPEIVLRAAFGGEGIVDGIPLKKQMIVAQAGGTGGYIFPAFGPLAQALEQILGTSPDLNGLDEPPFIDCDKILDQVAQLKPDIEQPEKDTEEKDQQGSSADTPSSDDSSDDEEQEEDEEEEQEEEEQEEEEDEEEPDEEDEMAICAEIELTWLRIILILVKIIKIIQKIVTFVLSILVPIIEIVRLAVGAWINPPNIAKIVQLIIQMVIAIIMMILAMILQLVWNLLNMDCVGNQTASIIQQITKALSTFASIMGAYNSLGVSLANQINRELMNPLEGLADDLNKGKENWLKLRDQFRDTFSEKGLNDMMEAAKSDILKDMKSPPQVEDPTGIVNDAKHMFSAAEKVKEQYAKMAESAKKEDLFAMKTGASSVKKSGSKAITKFKGLVGIEIQTRTED